MSLLYVQVAQINHLLHRGDGLAVEKTKELLHDALHDTCSCQLVPEWTEGVNAPASPSPTPRGILRVSFSVKPQALTQSRGP